MKLEINYKKKTGKFTNMWKLNDVLLNKQWVKEDITREIKKYFQKNENGNTTYQSLWDAGKAVSRGKFIVTNAYISRNISNKQPNFTPEGPGEEQIKPKVSRRKAVTDQSGNKTEAKTKHTKQRSMKLRNGSLKR